jgi:hypothetical protein
MMQEVMHNFSKSLVKLCSLTLDWKFDACRDENIRRIFSFFIQFSIRLVKWVLFIQCIISVYDLTWPKGLIRQVANEFMIRGDWKLILRYKSVEYMLGAHVSYQQADQIQSKDPHSNKHHYYTHSHSHSHKVDNYRSVLNVKPSVDLYFLKVKTGLKSYNRVGWGCGRNW